MFLLTKSGCAVLEDIFTSKTIHSQSLEIPKYKEQGVLIKSKNLHVGYDSFCVAYTRCIATLWYRLIYLFIYLSTRVERLSRGLV